jgi:hypothetical protein
MCFFLFSERLVKINFQKKIYFKAEINLCELIFKYFGNFDVAMMAFELMAIKIVRRVFYTPFLFFLYCPAYIDGEC